MPTLEESYNKAFNVESNKQNISIEDSYNKHFASNNNETSQPTGSFGQKIFSIPNEDMIVANKQPKENNMFKEALFDTLDGFYQGTESLFDKMDSAVKLIENSTGLRRGGLFEDLANQSEIMQNIIPDDGKDNISSTVFNFIGQTPAILAEFAAIPTGKLKPIASLAAKTGIISALEEYNNEETPGALAEGAIKGVTIGAVTGGTFKALSKGFELLGKFGPKAAETWVKLTTGDAKLAKDFVKNPKKYNLNLFGKTKTNDDIIKEFKNKKDLVNQEYKQSIDTFKDKFITKKEILKAKQIEAKSLVKEAQTTAKESLNTRNKITIDNVLDKSAKAIDKANQSLKEEAYSIIESAGEKYKLIRKRSGDAVNVAIQEMAQLNPNARINSNLIIPKINSIIQKESPFKLSFDRSKGRFVTKTAASSDAPDVNKFNLIMDEIMTMGKTGFPPMYLQDLKKATKDLATNAFSSGKNELGRTYQSLSNLVNPANIVSSNPSLQKTFHSIAKANKEYSSLIPKYEEAMKNYFKKDATGNMIPDIGRAINAVKSNDISAIRQMRKADLALPIEDRILPKIQQLVKNLDKVNSDNISMVKLSKRKAQQMKSKLLEANRNALKEISKSQRKETFDLSQKNRMKLKSFISKEKENLDKIINSLDQQEKFLLDQNHLRQFITQGKGFFPTLQRANIFGVVGSSSVGRYDVATAAGLNVALLSPKVAAAVSKPLLTFQQNFGSQIGSTAQKTLSNDTLKKLISSYAIKDQK